jgi:predicted DsbA family dithiol-disulfide isomerase
MPPVRIDIVADVTCPWCYIGKRRLDRALAMRPDIAAKRVWRPFQLNPELPRDGLPRELYLQIKFGLGRNAVRVHANIAAAGREEGIDFAFDEIHRTPNTINAHRLIALAGRDGGEDEMVEALFRGYFVEALDIGDIEVLAMIAAGCGLSRVATRRYLAGDDGTMEVLAEEYRARRIGIHAVPCFVIDNGYAVSGAQEPEMFLPLFDLAAVLAQPDRVEA